LFESVCSFVQTLPHKESPLTGQAQLALWHVCALGHANPQVPQFLESTCSLTHAPAHPLSPVAQHIPLDAISLDGHWQAPLWQLPPDGQVLPHVPQFATSFAVSTHVVPPHIVLHTQLAFVQTSPGVAASQAASTTGSLSTTPSQSLSLPSQTSGA
jgi:hypothetical protein